MAEKKGKKPDYAGNGIAVWTNTDRSGNTHLTVQLFGKNGIRVNCFRPKNQIKWE